MENLNSHGILQYQFSRPGKLWNFTTSFSRPGKSWNLSVGLGKSWKMTKNDFFFREQQSEKYLERMIIFTYFENNVSSLAREKHQISAGKGHRLSKIKRVRILSV